MQSLKGFKRNQSDNNDRAIRDEKAQHVQFGRNGRQTASLRWFFDVIPMILLEFSLRLTIP